MTSDRPMELGVVGLGKMGTNIARRLIRDDVRRASELDDRGIRYVDCGTSGGVHGLEREFA